MAGIVVNVFLADQFDATKVNGAPDKIVARLTANYQEAFDFANLKKKKDEDKHKFVVSWVTSKPTLKETDYLIHFLPVDFWSLARYMQTQKKQQIVFADEWGLTTMQTAQKPALVCSEVYVKSVVAEDLADLAFHEMLHGKQLQGNEMHTQKGLASAEVGNGIAINDANRQAVANTITTPRRTWPDGWDLAAGAANAKNNKDPLWNL